MLDDRNNRYLPLIIVIKITMLIGLAAKIKNKINHRQNDLFCFVSVIFKKASLVYFILILSGCSSFGEGLGRGITSTVLEKAKADDKRECRIWSPGFKGIAHSLDRKKGKTKVLMVHGIGHHDPGYATLIIEKLAKKLKLDAVTIPQKNLTITSNESKATELGNLRLTKLSSRDNKRELLFYELTWSSISEPEKDLLTYDQSGLVDFRRTPINNMLKKLTNDALADPMIYLGNKREDIQIAVAQSYCWMIAADYKNFPDNQLKQCSLKDKDILTRAKNDDYIFISHSLGSGITIDAMQRIARLINSDKWKKRYPEISDLHEVIRRRDITIFMLSNQLQLLQIGRDLPEVYGQQAQYCSANGNNYQERFANKTNIIALSDPNDILSYSIPQNYKNKYLDSRLCPAITNVNINIANILNLFNLGEVANPVVAHTGYDEDDRVIALLSYGLGNNNTSEIINSNCEWIKTVE